MSYGFATHLWILGRPGAFPLNHWLQAAKSDVQESDVVAWELGDRTLLAAVNTNDHEARWRSIEIITSVAVQVKGFDWVSIDLQPDHDFWQIRTSDREVIERDPEKNVKPSLEQERHAKNTIRRLVPLELQKIHHYVDWSQELEEVKDGTPAPAMPAIVVQRLRLGLPAARVPSRGARVPPLAWALLMFCIAASAFTVSAVQPPGPAAFRVRFLHFVIEGGVFWAMVFASLRESSGLRLFIAGLLAVLGAGIVWGLLPI